MPSNMAMKRPNTRIIRIDLHDNKPLRLQQLHISPLWILRIDDRAIPCPHTLVQHKHVVAVQMHWMDSAGGINDDEANAAVAACVVDVPFGAVGVGIVSCFGEEEDGGVVVAAKGLAVHGPDVVAGGVYGAADGDGYGCGGVGGGCDWEVGRGGCKWVLR